MLDNISEVFIDLLEKDRERIFRDSPDSYSDIIADAVHTSLNLISRSDALYHDVEHTCLVTLCGQDIFLGKKLLEGQLNAIDWLHYTIALLFHDIGYIKNILKEDDEQGQFVSSKGSKIKLKLDATDAGLTPYHVERGKIFVKQRKWNEVINPDLLCDMISYTQFPIPDKRNSVSGEGIDAIELASLVGCADLIGQLADPHYDKKIPCLFYEFLETGAAAKFGYKSPGDLRASYPTFFYNFVKPHLEVAIKYLNATDKGRQWVSNLNYHVFSQTHRAILEKSGIQLLAEIANYNAKNNNPVLHIKHALTKVCEYQGWPVGHAYQVKCLGGGKSLTPTKIWHLSSRLSGVSRFKEITNETDFRSGEGLPGRVFHSEKPEWILDVTIDPNFPRAKVAGDIGVRGAFAFPVFGNEGITHVLEFYSLLAEEPDVAVLSFMQQVSYEIGKKIG